MSKNKIRRLEEYVRKQKCALATYERLCTESMKYVEEKELQDEAHIKVLYSKARAANFNYSTYTKAYIN